MSASCTASRSGKEHRFAQRYQRRAVVVLLCRGAQAQDPAKLPEISRHKALQIVPRIEAEHSPQASGMPTYLPCFGSARQDLLRLLFIATVTSSFLGRGDGSHLPPRSAACAQPVQWLNDMNKSLARKGGQRGGRVASATDYDRLWPCAPKADVGTQPHLEGPQMTVGAKIGALAPPGAQGVTSPWHEARRSQRKITAPEFLRQRRVLPSSAAPRHARQCVAGWPSRAGAGKPKAAPTAAAASPRQALPC